MSRGLRITATVLGLILVTASPLPGLAADDPPVVGVLRLSDDPQAPDESYVFWKGGEVGDDIFYSLPLVGDPGIATCDNSPCFRYRLEVASPGATRLRIAIDVPTRNDNYYMEITAPGGTVYPETVSQRRNSNTFNNEAFITKPPVGTYDILVRPYSTADSSFEMRAKLEAKVPVPAPNEEGLLLPDLRPTSPYDLSFIAPANPVAGIAPDDVNPPLDVAGIHPLSCAWDETLNDNDVRCLRFSFGLVNAGAGSFYMRWDGFSLFTPDPTKPMTGPMYQCIQRSDGTSIVRRAGDFEFHNTHGHVHTKDIIYTELYKVTNAETGQMWAAGEGKKLGYMPADQALADWYKFNQAAKGTSRIAGSPCEDNTNNGLGLSAGWGDVYRWQRPGNYVDFGTNGDGLYVVRITADPIGHILESNESNNTGYTYVRVTGDQVEILEYGRGMSPWDPNKEVLTPRFEGGAPW